MKGINNQGYSTRPFSANRRLIAASMKYSAGKHTIHATVSADITGVRKLIRASKGADGRPMSLTAYVTACFSRVLEANPAFRSFRKGNKLIIPDDVTIGVLFEKEPGGEAVPENVPIRDAAGKSFARISDEIRAFQQKPSAALGELSGTGWVRLIPSFLLTLFVRIMAKNIRMSLKFGYACVSAVGMFSSGAGWFFPVTSATTMVTIGGIEQRCAVNNGRAEEREMLCLTLSFDHDIIDGAPAARFARELVDCIEDGRLLP